ncbi:MAG: hypothetical protein OXC44_02460 [Proteobacteria bacterium]|nr:hypothetical protein [Pseudomonadota bacterium]
MVSGVVIIVAILTLTKQIANRYGEWIFFGILLYLSGCGSRPSEFAEDLPRDLAAESQRLSQKVSALKMTNKRYMKANKRLLRSFLTEDHKGCFLKKPISSLTVRVGVDKQPPLSLGVSRDVYEHESWGTNTYSLELATAARSEFDGKEFIKSQGMKTDDFTHLQVGDIRYIRLLKNGVSVRAILGSSDRGCGLLWLFSCHAYEFYESDVWMMKSIQLSVNNTVLYDKKDLSHTFSGNNLAWQDLALRNHPRYRFLAEKNDCVVDETLVDGKSSK